MISDDDIRHMAIDACVDPRTFRRVLAGRRVRSEATRQAIIHVLRTYGYDAEASYLETQKVAQ